MENLIQQLLASGTGGAVAAGVILIFISYYLKGRDKERDDLAGDIQKLTQTIDTLKNERIKKLEETIEDHIDEDKTDRILTVVESTSSRLGIYEATQARHSIDIATLQANDISRYQYIENVNLSLQNHKKEKHS